MSESSLARDTDRPPERLQILVVEDEGLVARDLEFTLAEIGYDVIGAVDSCDAALRAVALRRPDVVLMDIHLKGPKDGIDIAETLSRDFSVPIVFITAYADDETIERAARTRAYGYIVKPFTGKDVRSAIEIARYKHEMDTRIAERERWFRTTLRSIGEGVVACDSDRRIRFMNPVAEGLTGWSEQEASGRSIDEVLRIIGAEPGEPGWLVARDGRRSRVIDDSVAPIVADDTVLGAVVVFRDVTEQRRIAEQMALTDRLTSLGTVAASVGHEINNPLSYNLTNISFALGELRELTKSPPSPDHARRMQVVLEALDEAQSGAERIAKIVSDLAAFSRSREDTTRAIDVRACIEWALKLTGNQLRHAAKLVKELGAAPLVFGNEVRLSQVFVNLLANAAQAIEGRPDDNEIRVVLATEDGHVVVEVSDTGGGVPPELADRVFEPFFATKASAARSGLGLSICRNLVEAMGGRISLDASVPGRTAFRVVLPPAREGDGAPTGPNASGDPERIRILVVDDDPLFTRSLRRMLQRGYAVTIADNGPDAAALLRTPGAYDVVLCALTMSEMSGMDLYEEVLVLQPPVAERIVFMTDGPFTPRAADFLALVGNRHITKPFGSAELLALVTSMTKGKGPT